MSMKASLSDQLNDLKLDFSGYGRLPIREDVIVFDIQDPEKNKMILKQWEKLNYLRKHLKIIDKYIQQNKGETLIAWLQANNQGLAEKVLKEIGDHNNSTGGISAYFLNLQNFYDQQEGKYDELETKTTMHDDIKNAVEALRPDRLEKRKTRGKTRKLKFRDLKADNKGYFHVNMEEPVLQNADGDAKKEPEKMATIAKDEMAQVKKGTDKIGVWIAGILITVTAVSTIMALKKSA